MFGKMWHVIAVLLGCALLAGCGGGEAPDTGSAREPVQQVLVPGGPEDRADNAAEVLKPRRRALVLANGAHRLQAEHAGAR